jgi:hypothetical protein
MTIFFLKFPKKPFVGFAKVFFSCQSAKFHQKKKKKNTDRDTQIIIHVECNNVDNDQK